MATPLDRLNQANANYDFDESDIRKILAKRLGLVSENRAKGKLSSREASSSRGLLHSSIALNEQADVDKAADTNIGDLNDASANALAMIQRKRTDAQNAYQQALADQARADAAKTPSFDPMNPAPNTPMPVAETASPVQAAAQTYVSKPKPKPKPPVKPPAPKPILTPRPMAGKVVRF